MELAYAKGVIYKTPSIDGMSFNLSTSQNVDYTKEVHSSAGENDGVIKSYSFHDPKESAVGNIKSIGFGKTENYYEIYYEITNYNDVSRLADHFNLSHPLPIGLLDGLEGGIDQWALDIKYKSPNYSYDRIAVASVKFSNDDVPFLLKMYRGNYIPSEQEIADAKAYWAANPI